MGLISVSFEHLFKEQQRNFSGINKKFVKLSSMNKFVIFVCLSAVVSLASARPDLSLGYRYNQGHSSSGSDFLQSPVGSQSSVSGSSSYAPTASATSYFSAAPSVGGYGGSTSGSIGSSLGGISYAGDSGIGISSSGGVGLGYSGQSQQQQQQQVNYEEQAFQAPIVTKHFYLHQAPVDHDEQQIVRHINIGRPQKNYRVVFINAPSSSASKAKIIANVAPVEEKTAIYVLAKKSNALDISTEVVTPPPVANKPEVFFIKYKTADEAAHAQHTIQTQYDQLGGTSDVVNQGAIPVTSVIGSLGRGSVVSGSASSISNEIDVNSSAQTQNIGSAVNIAHTGDNTQQIYLPANQRRF